MKNTILFFISPFLSIPFVLRGLFDQKQNAIILFSLIIAYLSFLYIPSTANDKAYYFELHDKFSSFTFREFIIYLSTSKADFLFYLVIYLFAFLGFSFQLTSLTITFLTIYIILNYSFLIMKNEIQTRSIWILFILTLILSISQPHIFSGMRNYLAVAFVFAGYYFAVISNNKIKTIAFCCLAIFTHFGTAPLALVNVLLAWFNFQRIIKLVFLCSLIFIFIPRDFLFENLSGFFTNEIYSSKISSYLGEKTFLENSLEVGNFNNYLRIVLANFWYWIGLVYVLYNFKNNESKSFIALLAYFAVCNVFYSAPDIFVRTSLFVEIILILSIFESAEFKKKSFIYIFSFYILLNSLFDIVTLRGNYYKSYVKAEAVFLPVTSINERIDHKDFINN